MGRNKQGVTERELDVLNVLWNSDKPALFALDIIEANNELTNNTVQAVIRSLKNKQLIDVADTAIRGNMVARSYKVLVSKQDFYLEKAVDDLVIANVELTMPDIVAALFNKRNSDAKDIKELEAWLEARKNTSKGE